MVLSETLSVDVIKVTIRDKPACQKRPADSDLVREAFGALRGYARRERENRQQRQTELEERITRRRLLQCLRVWQKCAADRALRANAQKQPSTDERIEQLVCAIAKKQQDAQEQVTPSNKKRSPAEFLRRGSSVEKRRPESKSKPQSQAKGNDGEARRAAEQTIKVAKQALRQCDQRTRRSLVHLMREQGCRSVGEALCREVPSGPPEFLVRMEERAQTRKERIQQLDRARQRQREEQKRREEASQREAQELERWRHLQAMREAQRVRKENEARRLRRLQAQQHLEHEADLCYQRYLFRRYALGPLTALLEERRGYLRLAEQHHSRVLTSRVFTAWREEWIACRARQQKLAERFYRRTCLWRAFDEWRCFAADMRRKVQVAVDFYEMRLQGRFLRALNLLRIELNRAAEEREAKAVAHHNRYLVTKYLGIWKQYMLQADDIKSREQRRDEWRDLIQRFIPPSSVALRT